MTYEEFILSKIINKDVENYELLLEAVLQTSVAPSTYLTNKLNKQKVSIGLTKMFGEYVNKSKNTSFNFYFLKEYREKILAIDIDSNKLCTSCNKELSVSYFYSNGYSPNGKKKYKSKCKKCQAAYDKSRLKNIIISTIGSYSCKICGYDKCIQALEFHHVNPKQKEYEINTLLTRSEKIILEEINKCILVCANCHREIHYGMHPEYLLE
jgi:hypothetical protein